MKKTNIFLLVITGLMVFFNLIVGLGTVFFADNPVPFIMLGIFPVIIWAINLWTLKKKKTPIINVCLSLLLIMIFVNNFVLTKIIDGYSIRKMLEPFGA
jgi:hypothetical protein